MARIVADIVATSARAPRVTIALALLLSFLALGFAASRFAMTTDTGALISSDIDWRRQERAMETAFPQLRDNMLVAIDAKTPELAEDAASRLAAHLAADKAHFRIVSRPDGGPFLAREGLLLGSRADVKQTVDALIEAQPMLGPLAADPSLRGVTTALSAMLDGVEQGDATLDQIEKPVAALADTLDEVRRGKPAWFSWQRLLSEDSALSPPLRRLILLQPVLDHGNLMPGRAASDALASAARSLGLDEAHGVEVRLTGEVPLADEEFATLADNIGLVAFVMLGMMLLTLWLATRSVRMVGAIMATVLTGLIVTTAVGLAAVGRLNLISVAFIPLFVGLGVDFGIQICVRYNAERHEGHAPADALRGVGMALGMPLLLAAGAIFLGFGAFLPTSYIGIAELGVIAGLGMIVALGFSLTLLPALLMTMGTGAPAREVGFRSLAPVDHFLARRRKAVLWAFALSMAISIALLPLVRFDFNPLHLRDPDAPAMRTLADLMHDPDRSPNGVDVLAPDIHTARALAQRLEALPEVGRVIGADSFVPADQPAKLALVSDASLFLDLSLNPFDVSPPPGDTELVAALNSVSSRLRSIAGDGQGQGVASANRLAAAFSALAAASPQARAQANVVLSQPLAVMLDQIRAMLQAGPVTIDTLPPEIRRDWIAPDGRARLQVLPRGNGNDNETLKRFTAAVRQVTPAISGLPVATQSAASTVAWAFVQAGLIALAFVSLLLLVVLRNLREVAFTLAPVVLSGFLTLGSCVLIGQPINFANIIAFPLLFGVGVAFHIYFVMAWRDGATDLLQSSLARAVLFSALATGTAFGSLWLSHHPGTASMGKILMISLAWTLVCALIFEPALLGPPEKRSKDQGALPMGGEAD